MNTSTDRVPPSDSPDNSVSLDHEADVAFITLSRPPVNALGLQLRRELHSALVRAAEDADIHAIVLQGAGRGFSAGGDRSELLSGEATAAPRLTLDVHPLLEEMSKPVVAAIHGYALGGGLETALACHFRVACADARVGLPEMLAGIVPLSGTQRLPRVMPMATVIDVILSGRRYEAREFVGTALFDRLVDAGNTAALRATAIEVVREALKSGPPYPLIRHRRVLDCNAAGVLDKARARAMEAADRDLRHAALDALAAAYGADSFDAGMSSALMICERLLARARVAGKGPHLGEGADRGQGESDER